MRHILKSADMNPADESCNCKRTFSLFISVVTLRISFFSNSIVVGLRVQTLAAVGAMCGTRVVHSLADYSLRKFIRFKYETHVGVVSKQKS